MKLIAGIYIAVFLTIMSIFILAVHFSETPEHLIVGKWKEVSWEYERVNKVGNEKISKTSEEIKQLLGEKLIIHQAETWDFKPNRSLLLIGPNSTKELEWRLKGRGHILQLKWKNHYIENYEIDVINDSVMIINFESDIEIRGIAKLTFTKEKKQYAQ
ncbi:hypothetical protein [Flavobacterium sp. U410]|jgi:hypothetical protein